MLDIAVSYNRYLFLGCEFLTWLWFMMEKQPDEVGTGEGHGASLEIGNRIVLENRYQGNVREIVTIKGDDAGLEEGLLSLKKGAMVSEINFSYKLDNQTWQFTLKGESFHITQIKTPETRPAAVLTEGIKDIETTVLEKAAMCEPIVTLVDGLYGRFIRLRISDQWKTTEVPAIRQWIQSLPNIK